MISKKYKDSVSKGRSHWLERASDVTTFVRTLKDMGYSLQKLKVLDAGCAQGRDSAQIATHSMEVIGIDSNEMFIAEAQAQHPGLRFDVGDIEDLPYRSESFGAVYCVNTLFYTTPEKSLPELERVLKTGGAAFITLDEQIVNLDENKEIHSLDVQKALQQFRHCDVVHMIYRKREDQTPFRHTHFYYEIVLRKLS